jgi:hypothetical protein
MDNLRILRSRIRNRENRVNSFECKGNVKVAGIEGAATVEEMGEKIFYSILEAASGRMTKSEILGIGENEFVPWRLRWCCEDCYTSFFRACDFWNFSFRF